MTTAPSKPKKNIVKKTPTRTTAKKSSQVKKTTRVKKVALAKEINFKKEVKSLRRSEAYISAVGRRKEAIARVRLYNSGSGKVSLNGQDLKIYFPAVYQQEYILSPLRLVGLIGQVDISIKVAGGGKQGQLEAVRHGVARAVVALNEEDYRKPIRTAGYLTRDARVKERKKYGLKKARRAPQFSKR